MSDQIHRETIQASKSKNTPDFQDDIFMNVSGMALPECNNKYWKIIDEQVIEMTQEEKAVVDYSEQEPELEPPTIEELNKKRDADIAEYIAIKYSLPAEMSLLWKLNEGVLTMQSPEIIALRARVAEAKVMYPKI